MVGTASSVTLSACFERFSATILALHTHYGCIDLCSDVGPRSTPAPNSGKPLVFGLSCGSFGPILELNCITNQSRLPKPLLTAKQPR